MTLTPPTASRSRRTVPKIVRRLFVFAAGLYVFSLLVLFLFQQPLIFHAQYSRATGGIGMAELADARRVRLHTKSGGAVTAYFGGALRSDGRPDPQAAHRPTLLFFYGQGGSAASCPETFAAFRRLDANVLIPDYAGFGRSGGEASEANCYATAQAAYDYLHERRDIDSSRIVLAGYSLGSGVAVDLAAWETARHQPPAGLVLFAAYTSMAEEAHQEYPLYPTGLLRALVQSPFASEQKLRQVTCPVLLVHSRADRKIPFWMSDRLAAACRGAVTRVNVDHAGHSDYFVTDGKTIYPALARFLERTNSHETQSSSR